MTASTSFVRSQVSDAEWEQRIHLAACYRMIALSHWDDLVFSHISVRAQSGGAGLIPISPEVISDAPSQVSQATRSSGGALAWPGLLRKLDRLDPSYRE
jgi:hypothetical protein